MKKGDKVEVLSIQQNGAIQGICKDDRGVPLIYVLLDDGSTYVCRDFEIKELA